MGNPRLEAVAALEEALGYHFNDRDLLERALTHSSVGDGSKTVRHYERLEFLGDRVLGLFTAQRLLDLYPDAKEGELSPRLAALVNGRTCARVARRIGLGAALKLSPGETKTGGRDKDTILGDACEALIAALYLDAGLERTREIFGAIWSEEFASPGAASAKDPKTGLQEWAQGRALALPRYEQVSRKGPDHAPRFKVAVHIEGFAAETGEGSSMRDAEKAAATAMLNKREAGE